MAIAARAPLMAILVVSNPALPDTDICPKGLGRIFNNLTQKVLSSLATLTIRPVSDQLYYGHMCIKATILDPQGLNEPI